jgi:hypothetical protein
MSVVPSWDAPAARLNLFSALAAALTVGLVALTAAELFPGEERRFPALVAALTAGLALATAGLFWSQAVISEVYTLHTFFLALGTWLLLRWRHRGGAYLPLAGLSVGLGLGNHLSLAFLVLGAAAFLLVPLYRPRRLWRAMRTGAPRGGRRAAGEGAAPSPVAGEEGPSPAAGPARGSPAAAPRQPGPGYFLTQPHRQPGQRELLYTLGAFLAGLLVYLYLPVRAAADPWLNWGDPRGWAAFWEHVSGQIYRRYLFQVPLGQALGRLSAVAGLLWRDFVLRGVLLGLGGVIILGRRDRAALALLAIPGGLGLVLALTYGGADSYVHLLPLYVAWALAAGVAAGMAAVLLRRRWGAKVALVALLLPLLGLPLFVRGHSTWNLRHEQSLLPGSVAVLEALPPEGMVLTNLDEQTFPLWYLQVVRDVHPEVAVVDVRLLEWPWYRAQLPARYPGLAIPAEAGDGWLRALLLANAARPAFALGPVPLPEGYLLRSAGPLFEVVGP